MRWITDFAVSIVHAICMVIVLCAVSTWMVLGWVLRHVPRLPRSEKRNNKRTKP